MLYAGRQTDTVVEKPVGATAIEAALVVRVSKADSTTRTGGRRGSIVDERERDWNWLNPSRATILTFKPDRRRCYVKECALIFEVRRGGRKRLGGGRIDENTRCAELIERGCRLGCVQEYWLG